MRQPAALIIPLLLATLCLATDTETFSHVKIHRHRSAKNRVLVDKLGKLTFDDANRKFTFEKTVDDKFDEPERVEVGYESVTKVVFEVTTHMRGGGLAEVVSAIPPVAMAGPIIADQHVHDYWFYVAYRNAEQDGEVLLEIPNSSSRRIIDKTTGVFGSRVVVNDFPETGENIEPEKLPDFKSKHRLKIDGQNRPVPENRPDKATIVVVLSAPRGAGFGQGESVQIACQRSRSCRE